MSSPLPNQPPHDEAEALHHLAGLRKMSATAGVALGEYQAVNPLAVTALVLGVASWMSLLNPLLFLLPVGGVILGLIAMVQVRRSNATQRGVALSGLAVFLSLGLGGWALASEFRQQQRVREQRTEIASMVARFGESLAAGDFDAAYQFTSENFRSEINPERFRNDMSAESARLGGFRSASSNELARIIEDSAGSLTADAMMVVEIGAPQPLRQEVVLVRQPDGWRIQEFQAWFPRAGRRRPAPAQ